MSSPHLLEMLHEYTPWSTTAIEKLASFSITSPFLVQEYVMSQNWGPELRGQIRVVSPSLPPLKQVDWPIVSMSFGGTGTNPLELLITGISESSPVEIDTKYQNFKLILYSQVSASILTAFRDHTCCSGIAAKITDNTRVLSKNRLKVSKRFDNQISVCDDAIWHCLCIGEAERTPVICPGCYEGCRCRVACVVITSQDEITRVVR